MHLLQDEILKILDAGSNIVLNCRSSLPEDLIQLAEKASDRGVNITFKNFNLRETELMKIANAGKNSVTFDL